MATSRACGKNVFSVYWIEKYLKVTDQDEFCFEIEPNKLECVLKFCYLGDTLGAGGSVNEAARARVRCA